MMLNGVDKEIPEPDISGWSEDDIKWLEKVSPVLQLTAKRHGRFIFSVVYQAGVTNASLQLIARRTAGNREMQGHLGLIAQTLEGLLQLNLEARGLNQSHFDKCRRDMELVMQLSGADAPRNEKGKIVVS